MHHNINAVGNMTTLSTGNGAVYNPWDRLAEVDDASGAPVEKYEYDGTGRRIQIFSSFSGGTPSTVEDDYHSGQQVVETRENGDIQYQYVWSARYIDAPICRDTLDSSGNVESPTTGRIYYLGDANYNVTAVVQYSTTDSAWQVAERYTYDPYGIVTIYKPDWSGTRTSSSVSNTILYAGETFDAANGLYFDNARYYDPTVGAVH